MVDKFSTAFYEAHDILTCPDGSKLRSDDEGTFCWLDGERVPARALNGQIILQPVVVEVVEVSPTKTPAPSKSKVKGETTDANG